MTGSAIVTGASRGIGRAIALEIAALGHPVAVVYAGNTAEAEKTCEAIAQNGGSARAYKCDVSDYEAAKALAGSVMGELGPVSVLINNAGITRDGLIMRMEEDDFQRVMDINLKGAFNMTRHLAQGLLKQRFGRIINISSVVGLMGNAGQTAYAAAKAGLIGLTKSCAKEFAARGVTCNAIAPGYIQTDMTAGLADGLKAALLEAIPLKRAGLPSDVAKLAAFLASDAGAYITGAVLPVDGGLSM